MGIRARVRELLDRPGSVNIARYRPSVDKAGELEGKLRARSDAELTAEAERLRGEPFGRTELIRWYALVREVARRELGQRPFDVQLLGAGTMLDGNVVEMATGEGKTLVAAMVAAGYALQGRRVHVISVNDYLARRDAEWMAPIYDRLGVTVDWLDQQSGPEQRRAAYGCAVTYVSVSELGFDVLRDRMCTEPETLVTDEPDVAIVDEVDSVLVDEATVPLVLAGATQRPRDGEAVAELVAELDPTTHYEVDADQRNVNLTDAGLDHVEQHFGGIELYTEAHAGLLTSINLALHARALLHKDVDYLVREGKVDLINPARGRVAKLQRWPDGLQAAVEAKEGLTTSATGEVLDSAIVQSLIARYHTVTGCSGTAMGVAAELAEFYKLRIGAVPTNLPCVREDEPDRIYETVEQKEAALVEYVRSVHETGRPVLLGTASVAESERLAGMMEQADVPEVVLNAKNDAEEALIIARAGEYGRVTISTQMAGRGVDIRLGGSDQPELDQPERDQPEREQHEHDRIAELGGLCVVGSGRYHTSRLDDQLRGRAGRQGDPGSSVLFASLGDPVVTHNVPDLRLMVTVDEDGRIIEQRAREAVDHAQRVAEGVHLAIHRNTWRYHQLIDLQRADVLQHRDLVLHGDRGAGELRERGADRYAELLDQLGDQPLEQAARLIVLHHIDRAWTEHLALLSDVREGIHLRALARETPIDEFHRIAVREFADFFEHTYEASVKTFENARITAEGVDLEDAGIQRPTSTWTYMVTDNPFGSEHDRMLRFLTGATRNSTD